MISTGGKPVDMDKVRIGAQQLLASTSTAVMLFDAVFLAEAGDNTGLARVASLYDTALPGALVWGDLMAKGSGEGLGASDRVFVEERRSTADVLRIAPGSGSSC